MVDYQRQLLDELMGRNRNLDPGQKAKEKTWKDSDNCKFFMVRREKPGKGLKVEYLIKNLMDTKWKDKFVTWQWKLKVFVFPVIINLCFMLHRKCP